MCATNYIISGPDWVAKRLHVFANCIISEQKILNCGTNCIISGPVGAAKPIRRSANYVISGQKNNLTDH
jgi:hypothetical protein